MLKHLPMPARAGDASVTPIPLEPATLATFAALLCHAHGTRLKRRPPRDSVTQWRRVAAAWWLLAAATCDAAAATAAVGATDPAGVAATPGGAPVLCDGFGQGY